MNNTEILTSSATAIKLKRLHRAKIRKATLKFLASGGEIDIKPQNCSALDSEEVNMFNKETKL